MMVMVGGIANDVPLLCFVCNKTFCGRNKRQHLSNHLTTHTGEKPFCCPFCPHRSNRKDNLKMHVKLKHLDNLGGAFRNTLGGDSLSQDPSSSQGHL
ncbi:Zinc finger protein 536 [Portunus trituberculatus]|uniref:Zinc finger protein 536 n=1 Tax=Portunus trituberculatus TaxID=210409 RepID=A0A5B7CP37_PORTR|nr:Zinc finger protein 536 [Portunus trituberculatus]